MQKHAKPPPWESQKRAWTHTQSRIVNGRWQHHNPKNKKAKHTDKKHKTPNKQNNKQPKKHRLIDKMALCKFKAACVLMVGPCVDQTRHRKQKQHNRKAPGKGAKSKTTRCGNPGSPQPGSRRSQRDAHRAQQAPRSQGR